MAVKTRLEEVDTPNLEVVMPGVVIPADPEETMLSREDARKRLGVRDDALLLVAIGRFQADKGFEPLVNAMAKVRDKHPLARLYLSGSGSEPPPIHQEGVDVTGPVPTVWPALCAADLVVVPSRRAGFSLLAAEAMWAGVPVLMRSSGGLVDMGEEGLNAFFFAADDELAPRINEILDMELARETVARGGQLRSQARFKFDRFAREMAHVYREVAGA